MTCLWLMPFYPTADRDDGYDVTDFYGVDPRLGTHGDLVEIVRTARDHGMRVIVDLVVNHTSDKHPWFVAARRSKTSPFRDFYVWRDEPPENNVNAVFPGEESTLWELDEKTGQYYLHSFYSHQPDLNIANPTVRDEIAKTIGFWLQMGISGFRVDAVPFLIEVPEGKEFADPHQYLRDLRQFLRRRSRRPCCSARSTCRTASRPPTSAAARARSSPSSSTSTACRRCTSRSHGPTPGRWRRRSALGRPSRPRRSGRTSCATTTS
nr:hypothetical protein GCM10025699_15960 [Microbacterium flavescens]